MRVWQAIVARDTLAVSPSSQSVTPIRPAVKMRDPVEEFSGTRASASQAVLKAAVLDFDPGEIYEFEFTPSGSGELTLTFGLPPQLVPPPVAGGPAVTPGT